MRAAPLFFILPCLAPTVFAAKAGSFEVLGDTLVSAMMLFLGNNDKVYIMDKAEGNAAQVNGHPAWGSVWDLNTNKAEVMEIKTNTFCSSGHHLPNGSFATFGGNGAIGPDASRGSDGYADDPNSASWDSVYQDFDGAKSIRILNPCTSDQDMSDPACQWFDDPSVLSMQAKRWYSAAEALADGTITMIGGFVDGGYILRLYPNTDPTIGAELSYEFFPSNGQPPQDLPFLHKTSGLNAYPHAFLLNSGKMFLQANLSTTIWDYSANTETDLPDMPNGVVRVYPASAATAMLPMTPANNYSQTIIFCGGSDMDDAAWGNFVSPSIATWYYPASKDCQRITPEPADGSVAKYTQEDDMIEGRTMGQFIILPDGKLLVVNGGLNGTAGFGRNTTAFSTAEMPYGQSYASGPVGQPAIFDPNAPKGQRWSNVGFDTSQIARLYHSSAILLPDASVFIAGSNPNLDVNTSTTVPYPTEYRAEKFYPPYFSASTRPAPSGMPSTLSYGGDPFDITIPASSYSGSGNDAAAATIVSVIRPGWTTHAMNMGQRYLQLNNTYTVNSDSSITLHVSQMPPQPNIFQPGPALLFVVVDGIPSNGTHVIVGSGKVEKQPTAAASTLPPSVLLSDANGSGSSSGSPTDSGSASAATQSSGSSSHIGLIAGIAGGAGALALIAIGVGICLARRRRSDRTPMISDKAGAGAPQRVSFGAAPYARESLKAESQVWLTDEDGHGPGTPVSSTYRDIGNASPVYGYSDAPNSLAVRAGPV
ncbi:copper radical oxidase variant A [Roridomyces roridus]|uniref:Copper radical oxidase variant A n=1 Tax=Roridomyces roridus TaxID=1738132 RepID=A0AAD7CN01_9AGAR|nr:copper radical oxidase variant A [Roridomyces roridus]